MKIAILSNYYASSLNVCAGYNLKAGHPFPWVKNLAEGLSRIQNNDVHVVTLSNDFGKNGVFQENGVQYHFLQTSNKYIKAITLYESEKWKIRNYLQENRFDIVHGQGFDAWGYRAICSRLPNVVTIHLYVPPGTSSFNYDETKPTIGQMIIMIVDNMNRRRLYKKMKYVISISPFLTNQLNNEGFSGDIREIENPISLVFFEKYPLADERYILFIGAIDRRKSLLTLLEAFNMLSNVRLKVISQTTTGEYYYNCLNYIKEHNLSKNVDIIGPVKNEEIVSIMSKCSFLVLPSLKEMSPMVISEAMAIGKPVIASDVDGIPYMVKDGVTGLLFEAGNVRMLADKMNLLIKDRDLCNLMGQKGREEALKRWHPDVVARKTMDVYQKIIGA
jgi:glycosyltransferase involved in cell wall biosynthesis